MPYSVKADLLNCFNQNSQLVLTYSGKGE